MKHKSSTYTSKFARARHFAGIKAAIKARQVAAQKAARLRRYGILAPLRLSEFMHNSNLGLAKLATLMDDNQ